MKTIKHIFYCTLYFSILYGENFSVFSIPFTLVWKIPLLCLLLVYILNVKKKRVKVAFSGKSIILALQKNLNASLTFGFENIIEALKTVNLSLFTYFFINYYKVSQTLKTILKSLAIYTIISFIPFSLNIISSVGSGVDAEVFGGESGITGFFSSAHNASITVSVSILVLVFFFSEYSKKMKIVIGILVIYGLYILLFTYTRTGLVALLISLIYYFMKNLIRINFFQLVLVLSIVSIPVYYIVSNNESIQNKILDKRSDDQVLSSDNVGSGRFVMWNNSINIWLESDQFEKLLGLGKDEALERMQVKIGKPFFSHNEFLDVLIRYGLVGLILYLIYLRSLYLFIARNTLKGSGSMAIYIAYLINLFFQGGHFFVFELFFALYIVYDYKRKIEFQQRQQ